MKDTLVKSELVSFCGLYCGSCSKYKKGKCPGCAENEKATWCKIRSCCIEKGIKSCANCKEFQNVKDCKKFDNFVAKMFEFVFKSDRKAGIKMIKESGYDEFAKFMAENELVSMKKSKN
ncbi:MAG: DUF3795 domain-containing protein [Bacteroidales bacterium]|nr:DUF3795 domain-containing protein [Bacteroidales bacterium]